MMGEERQENSEELKEASISREKYHKYPYVTSKHQNYSSLCQGNIHIPAKIKKSTKHIPLVIPINLHQFECLCTKFVRQLLCIGR